MGTPRRTRDALGDRGIARISKRDHSGREAWNREAHADQQTHFLVVGHGGHHLADGRLAELRRALPLGADGWSGEPCGTRYREQWKGDLVSRDRHHFEGMIGKSQ